MERLAVDIDETIVHLLPHFLKWWNPQHGTSFSTDDFFCYRWWEVLGTEKEQAYSAFHRYIGWKIRNNPEQVDFVEGAPEALCSLRDSYEIHAITDRHPCCDEDTREISRRLCLLRPDLLPMQNVHLTQEERMSKPDLCRRLGIDTIVEDNASRARQCADEGIRCLLLNRRWNQGMPYHDLIVPVADWQEAYRLLNGR